MNTILTFDYELFFGAKTGTVQNCMLNPTEQLLKVLKKQKILATFYIDVGYFLRCQKLKYDSCSLAAVYKQLCLLSEAGHDLQLHIHPHWEDAHLINGHWSFQHTRYRLHQFSKGELRNLIAQYIYELEKISGRAPIAYRAGGWCMQPFNYIADELFKHGIRVDSTVFANGKRTSQLIGFDFSNAPDLPYWKFDSDPLQPAENGRFYELPISSIKVFPYFYWQMALTKILKLKPHRPLGDGSAMRLSTEDHIKLLTCL